MNMWHWVKQAELFIPFYFNGQELNEIALSHSKCVPMPET